MPFRRLPRTITAPGNAGPDDARTVIGPDVPDALLTIPGNRSAVAATLRYKDATTYTFEALTVTPGGTYEVVRGFVNPIDGIKLIDALVLPSGGWVIGDIFSVPGSFAFEVVFHGAGLGVGVSHDLGHLAPFKIDGRHAGRGLVGVAGNSTISSGLLTVETVLLEIVGVNFKSGRAYEARFQATVTGSATPMGARFRLRRNTTGPVRRDAIGKIADAFAHDFDFRATIRNTAADITHTLTLTLTPVNGPVGSSVALVAGTTTVNQLELWDIGAAADYPDAIQI